METRPARRRAVERVGWGITLVTLAASISAASLPALGATSASLSGTVTAAGKPLASAGVTLLAGSRTGTVTVGRGTTDPAGRFTLSYTSAAEGVLYLEATPSAASRLRLRAVVGAGSGGGVQARTLASVTVNELTTVAAGYALAQFSGSDGISGPSPGLENAAATAFNLVDSATGSPARS